MSTPSGEIRWSRLYGVLSECYKHPDERFHEDVREGRLESELEGLVTPLDIEIEVDVDPTHVPDSVAAFDNEYIALFEAFETPYAPPIESPYKEWHDGPAGDGLVLGPPAEDMKKRFATLDVEIPDAYMPDHLALLLEYAAFVVEHGTEPQHRVFVADHLDWIPAFRQLVEDASADAHFHRRCVLITDEILKAVRQELDVAEPDAESIESMQKRVESGMEGIPDEKHFRA